MSSEAGALADAVPTSGLVVAGVRVVLGATVAVAGADLAVAEGEIVGLLGPSGCGKSSLLRAIAGLETPATGTIAWQGRDLLGEPPHQRGIGLMFQHHALFPHRNVIDNVGFGLRMQGVGRAERANRARELLSLVGLEGFAERRVATLSGGEAQRVALARALAPTPRLLLLDEPLASLDRALRDRLALEIRSILRRVGTTAIHVTHDHDEAVTVADRIALMSAGRILASGTIDALVSRPGSVDVAAALGLETIFVAHADADGVVATPWGTLPGRSERAGPVTVLLQAAHVEAQPEGSGVAAVVVGRIRRGERWWMRCRMGDAGSAQVFTASSTRSFPEGTVVGLVADLGGAQILDSPDPPFVT